MSGIKNGESSHRSLLESQFRWRAAPPDEPVRLHEQGSRGKIKNGARRESSQQFQEEGLAFGLNLPSSVLAAYGERGRVLPDHEQSNERKRSDPSDKEALSTFILYDHSGRIIPSAPKRNSSILSERPRYQEDIDDCEYRRRHPDQVAPCDRRPTPPPRSAPAAGPTESALVKAASHQHPQLLPRPPAPAPPPSQIGVASLDLQPAPSSNNSHIHPAILQNSATALAPIRILYEQAWYQTVSNVQNEMTRMHRELVDALDRERAARSRLAEENKTLQQDLERTKADLRDTRRDSDKFKDQCDRLIAENESLRQAAKVQVAQRGDRDDQVREVARLYIDEQLGQLKTQYGEQVEKQRAEAERALEQQKVMFEKERKELHKIAVAHERSVQRSGSESASTLVASDTEKVLSPFYDRGLHKNSVPQELTHYDRPRGHRMSVSSGTKSPTSSRASPQLFSGSLSRRQTASYRALSPLTPSIPPKEAFPATTPEDGHVNHHRDSVQTDNAMDVDMDVDVEQGVVDLISPMTSPIRAPDTVQSAIPSASAHYRPVSLSPQSPTRPACHMSSSRSPSIPLASILPKPLTSSPSLMGDREQPAHSARPSPLPATILKTRSRRSSLLNQNLHHATPPMGSLGMRPYSQPASRSASRAVSPSRPNSVARPTLKLDVSPVVPPIAVLEELNLPSRQQQEPPSSAKPLKTEPQSLSLLPSAQIQSTHRQHSKPTTPQPQLQQQQQPRPAPLPPQPPRPPPPQQLPPKSQLPQPAQPSKQLTARPSRPPPPPPPQPPQSSQNGPQKPPQQPPPQYTYQSHFPVHNQTGSRAWISYPYSYHYQYSPPLPVSAAPESTPASMSVSASGSFFSTQRKRDRVEYEEDTGTGERARAKVKLEDGSGDGPVAAAPEIREVKKTNRIGITHMDLLYETRDTKMICRMCRMPSKDEQKTPTATFPVDAKWAELIGHCQSVHPKSCADLEKLSPSQVQELRQRMQSGKLTGYTLRS